MPPQEPDTQGLSRLLPQQDEDEPRERSLASGLLRSLRENDLPAPLRVRRFDSPLESNTAAVGSRTRSVEQLFAPVRFVVDPILKVLGIGVTEEELQQLGEGDRVRDVTDPSIALSQLQERGVEVTGEEMRVRGFNRFLASAAATTNNLGRGGLERAYTDGTLAPPETTAERVADIAGQILSDIGVTLPFAGPLGAGTRALGGGVIRKFIPSAQRTIEQIQRAVTVKYGALAGAKYIDEAARRLTNLGVDVELGLLLGGVHVANRLANGEDLTVEESLQQLGQYAAFGFAAGGVFQGVGALGINRRLRHWQEVVSSGPWQGMKVGTTITVPDIGEVTLVGKGPKGGAQWKGPDGKFVRPPTPEEIGEHIQRLADEAAAVAERAGTIENVPPTLPGLDDHAQEVQSLAAAWAPTVRERAGLVSRETLQAEMEMLTRQATDLDLPQGTRMSLLGRARAIQGVLGELDPLPGAVPLEVEQAAVALSQLPRQAALLAAARAEAAGQPALAARIIAHVNSGLPDLKASRVNALLEQGEQVANRGLVKGDRVRSPDGSKQYVLLDDPEFGVATVSELRPKRAGGNQSPEVLSLNEIVPRPKAGTTARLRSGEVVEILETQGGKVRQMRVRRANGEEATYNFSDVQELGHARTIAKQHQRELRQGGRPRLGDDAQPVPPARVVTPEGEAATAVAVGRDGVRVRTRNGRTRTVRTVLATKETAQTAQETFAARLAETTRRLGPSFDEEVKRRAGALRFLEGETPRSRTERAMRELVDETVPPTQERQVLAFAPGTRPSTDNRILYVAIPESDVGAFEAAYVAGQPLGKYVQGGLHVLPPATPGEGVVLYGLELPAARLPNKLYSPEAKAAVRALQGKSVRLESYSTPVNASEPVIRDGQLYRVPEALHARAMRSARDLAELSGEERTQYLRRLLDFSEDIDSPVAEAATKKRAAQRQRVRAAENNDGEGVAAGRVAEAEGTREVVDRILETVADDVEASAPIVRRAFVESAPEQNAVIAQAIAGDRDALRAVRTRLLEEGDQLILFHQEVPGRLLRLSLMEGDNRVVAEILEGGKERPFTLGLANPEDAGFVGGTHRARPGDWEHVLHPGMTADVNKRGFVRLWEAERVAGSDDVVWRLSHVASPDDAEGFLHAQGFTNDLVSAARSGEGTVGAGFDRSILTKLGASLYKGNLGPVIVREGIQNAVDAVRAVPGAGQVTVGLDSRAGKFVFRDTGVGMSPAVAEREFLDVGGSFKPLGPGGGSTGGFGIAKVGLFANASSIRMVTVADVGGKRVRTFITGSGDDWANGRMTFRSETAARDTPTGTSLELEVPPELIKEGRFQTDSALEDIIARSDPKRSPITLDRDASSDVATPRNLFTRSEEISKASTGAADVTLSAVPETGQGASFGRVHILNNGLYQFSKAVHYRGGASGPSDLFIDILPKVGTEDIAYPFTTSRDAIKSGPVEDAVDGLIDSFAASRASRRNETLRRSIVEAPKAQGGHRVVAEDAPELAARIAREAVYVDEILSPLRGLLRTLDELLAGGIGGPASRFAPSTLAGITVEPGLLGVNVGGRLLADALAGKATGEVLENSVFLNLHTIFREASQLAEKTGLSVHGHATRRTLATLIHEAAHNVSRGHNEHFAGVLTRLVEAAFGSDEFIRISQAAEAAWERTLASKVWSEHYQLVQHHWSKNASELFNDIGIHAVSRSAGRGGQAGRTVRASTGSLERGGVAGVGPEGAVRTGARGEGGRGRTAPATQRAGAGTSGDLADLLTWEVGPATQSSSGEPLFGGALARTRRTPGHAVVDDAVETLAQREANATWGPAHLQAARGTLGDVPGTSAAYGVYTKTGQPVRIASADPSSPNVSVEFADGRVLELARSEVRPVKPTSKHVQDYRLARSVDNGDEYYSQRLIPEMGYGQLERDLGLFGATRTSAIRDRAVEHAQEQLRRLDISNGEVLGSPEAVERLLATYDRALDLGFADDVLSMLPKDAADGFKEAAFMRLRQRIPSEEYGLLFAGAKYDRLSKQQVAQLREVAKELKLKSDLPPHRIVEELWNRREIDPAMARWTLDFRKDLGAVRVAHELGERGLGPDAVVVRRPPDPRGKSWYGSQWLNPTTFEMEKDPILDLAHAMVRDLHERMQQAESSLASRGRVWQRQRKLTFPDGTTRGVKTEDLNWARDLAMEHSSWDEVLAAKAAGAKDPRRFLYEEFLEIREGWRDRMLRLQMRAGVAPARWSELPDGAKAQFLASHPWVVESEMLDDFWLVPSQMARLQTEGVTVRAAQRSDESVTEMLSLLRRYDSSEDLPVGIEGWMRDEFDLWKRFGRKNYWPLLHEGEMALEVQTASGWKAVGYAESFPEAVQLYGQLKRGREHGELPYRIVQKRAHVDDILTDHLSAKERFDLVNSLRDATIADEEVLSGLFVPRVGRRERPSPARKKPIRAPLEERTPDALTPPVRDAWTEMQIQERRLARLEYRFGVSEAYRATLDPTNPAARDLAEALAAREGLPSIFSDARRELRTYGETWFANAAGIPSRAEQTQNSIYAIWQMLAHAPRIQLESWLKQMTGKGGSVPEGLWRSTNWRAFGQAQQRASELVAFQAMWRMGLGPATALTNATQYHMYCCDVETEALTRRGWKRWDELEVGEEILAYDFKDDTTRWEPLKAVHSFYHDGPVHVMENSQISARTTEGHRWPVTHRLTRKRTVVTNGTSSTREMGPHVKSHLNGQHLITLARPTTDLPQSKTYDDDFIELCAWVASEGCYLTSAKNRFHIQLSQSFRWNPEYSTRIEELIQRLDPGTCVILDKNDCCVWNIKSALSRRVLAAMPDKTPSWEFLSQLTEGQLRLFLETSIAGDGVVDKNGHREFCNTSRPLIEKIHTICVWLGIPARTIGPLTNGLWKDGTDCKPLYRVSLKDKAGGRYQYARVSKAWRAPERYQGVVWCPEVSTGFWVARRNGHTYMTGNTTPLLMREFGWEATWAARGSWMNAINLLFKIHRPGELKGKFREWAQIVEEAGIGLEVGRHMAGASTIAAQVGSSLSRPTTFGLGLGGKAKEWINFTSMYLFNGAEQVNRVSTALATYRAARHKSVGLSHEAAIQKVRETIAGSQFWYDHLNLPQAMREGGPALRVLLQFKPFVVNAARYELNMAQQAVRGLRRGDLQPATAAAYHAALFFAYGGALGMLRHPIIDFSLWAASLLPGVDSPSERRAKLAERLREGPQDIPEEFQEASLAVDHPTASRLLLHGLPGLLNVSMGERLGITGQDLNAMESQMWLGPHVSVVKDFLEAAGTYAFGESAQRGSGATVPMMALGWLAPGFIKLGGTPLQNVPFTRMLGATAAARFGPNGEEWRAFLTESPEGRRFIQRSLASALRNGLRSWNIYSEGFYRDTRGHPIEIPYSDRGTEALLTAGGLPTTRSTEQRAYLDWLRPEAFSFEATRLQYARQAAAAYTAGNVEEAWRVILRAQEQGIPLEWDAIERQIERRNLGQFEALVKSLPAPVRFSQPE